jgi:CVNH domain
MTIVQQATTRPTTRQRNFQRYLKTFGLITIVGVSANLAMPIGKAQARGDFSLSCVNLNVMSTDFSNTALLTADCTNQHGRSVPASINLNDLIADDQDGNMQWASHGHFQRSCLHSGIENPFNEPRPHNLAAFCLRENQSEVLTDIDLDQHIANINGKLMFVP